MDKSFRELLTEQKERFKGEKEQIPIYEAATDFALQNTKEVNLQYRDNIQSKGMPGEPERVGPKATELARNFVSQDLIRIQDANFQEFKNVIKENEALLNELPKSRSFNATERDYIREQIEPVINELAPLATTFRRLSFAARDFKKQFKPIKLADRFFGGIPILGGVIKRKIERTEAGEERLKTAEKGVAREKAEAARKLKGLDIDELDDTGELAGTGPTQGSGALEEFVEESQTPSPIISKTPEITPLSDTARKRASGEEEREELQAKKDDQYEEQRGLLEMIAESTYESNENLKKLVEAEEGLDVGDAVGTAATVGGSAAAGGGAALAAKKFLGGSGPAGKSPSKKLNVVQKAKNVVKNNASKAGKVIKTGARFAARAFIPLAAALAIFDTAKAASSADEILGKDKEDLTLRDKTSAGVGGLLEGLSFGLIKKEKVAKFLAGKSDSVEASEIVPNASEVDQAAGEVKGNVKDMVNINSKRTMVRTTLETDSLTNSLEKLFKDMQPKNNTVIAPNNTLNNSNSTNIMPDLSNKNLDETIIALKKVY